MNDSKMSKDKISPLIGVVLMLVITAILAAVIATFVLGLSDVINGYENSKHNSGAEFSEYTVVSGETNVKISLKNTGGDFDRINVLTKTDEREYNNTMTGDQASVSMSRYEIHTGSQIKGGLEKGDSIRVEAYSEDETILVAEYTLRN